MSEITEKNDGCFTSKRYPATQDYPGIQVRVNPTISWMDWAHKAVKCLYTMRVAENKRSINWHMKGLYGRIIVFAESNTTDTVISLKKLLSATGVEKTCQINDALSDYLGERVCLFRNHGNKRIPVEMDRIENAYLAAQRGEDTEKIRSILYNE